MPRSICALSALFIVFLCAGSAHAQATRTWISGVGDDVNPCSRTAPCKTFAGAISKTAAGGEIDALDPGGFGAVTITKSITLDGGAGLASILASGTNGIIINAGSTDVVILRNLSINGAGTTLGLNGVKILAAGAVHIEDTVISNFSQNGISGAPSSPAFALYVKNTAVRSCNTALLLSSANSGNSAASIAGSVWNSVFVNAPVGIAVDNSTNTQSVATARLALYNTVLSGHSTAALQSSGPTQVTVERGVIAGSAIGVNALGGNVQLSGVMLSQNTTGLVTQGGTVTSYGNNALAAGNQTDGAVTTTVPLQ